LYSVSPDLQQSSKLGRADDVVKLSCLLQQLKQKSRTKFLLAEAQTVREELDLSQLHNKLARDVLFRGLYWFDVHAIGR